VRPHVPDAWIDHDKTKKGYEIPFTRHFYEYTPLPPLEEIQADILGLEAEVQQNVEGGDGVTQRTFTDEVLADAMAEILRAKTPAQRQAISFGMWRFARNMILANLRQQHRDWTEEACQQETARRMAGGIR
jgi:hypothetical protein